MGQPPGSRPERAKSKKQQMADHLKNLDKRVTNLERGELVDELTVARQDASNWRFVMQNMQAQAQQLLGYQQMEQQIRATVGRREMILNKFLDQRKLTEEYENFIKNEEVDQKKQAEEAMKKQAEDVRKARLEQLEAESKDGTDTPPDEEKPEEK